MADRSEDNPVSNEDLATAVRHAAAICRHVADLLAGSAGMTRRAVIARIRTCAREIYEALGVEEGDL